MVALIICGVVPTIPAAMILMYSSMLAVTVMIISLRHHFPEDVH